MARVLRGKLNKKAENFVLKALLGEIKKINSIDDLNNFFNKFLTQDERTLILRRLAIIPLINEGKKYREIEDILDISSGTISAVKDILLGRGYNKKLPKKKDKIFKAGPIREKKKAAFPFPPYRGKGRWKFLNYI